MNQARISKIFGYYTFYVIYQINISNTCQCKYIMFDGIFMCLYEYQWQCRYKINNNYFLSLTQTHINT